MYADIAENPLIVCFIVISRTPRSKHTLVVFISVHDIRMAQP